MRSFTLCLALFLVVGLVASGQEVPGKKAFYIHSLLGVSVPATGDLNNALQRSGHPELPTAYFARGGGFYAFFNNTRLVQLTSFATYSGSRQQGSRSSWARATQISAALGMDLRRRTRLQAIPYAGVAYSFFGLRTGSTGSSATDFSRFLLGGATQRQARQNQWLANAGLHLGASPVGKSGFGQKLDLALRAGYYLPLSQRGWKAGDTELNNGPDVNTGGLYAGLVLGIRQ